MASHFQRLKIDDIRRETADCVSISLTVPAGLEEAFRYHQGQNITVRTYIDGEEVRRSYSICSSPLDRELRIAVKKVPGGRFSTFANEVLQPGQELEVLPPSGKFYTELNPDNRKHYLAFAAGSGITPVLSIIKTTLAVEPGSHFTLVYGNRHRPSIIFREQLEALKNRYMDRLSLHHVLSREEMDIALYQGHIDAAKCRELCGKVIDLSLTDDIYLCGPEKMIFSIKDWLEQQGVERRKIHFELFHPMDNGKSGIAPAEQHQSDRDSPGEAAGRTSQVTVRLDGINHVFALAFEGAPILDAALYEGVDLPFACKGGVCCTCRARLAEGKVEMDLNYALEADELAAGFILTCQSHPRSPKVVVDFDSK
ncbi:MAG TPA: 1,2-phenylacetyl-CoA epoxidase subunit PaaE [Puia sp.]|nr:1,2-phenylacetyl-CoA epoxidase subunit PaaE [Puia sp.]